jgi:hypothetical protein
VALKFVTRSGARVDRIACPWLVHRFIDPDAEILFVPNELVLETAKRENAVPFDIPNVELGHRGERCSFDAFLAKYRLDDPALHRLAEIVRGADTNRYDLTSESAGLYAIANGFNALQGVIYPDDHAMLAAEKPVYDALYASCRAKLQSSRR